MLPAPETVSLVPQCPTSSHGPPLGGSENGLNQVLTIGRTGFSGPHPKAGRLEATLGDFAHFPVHACRIPSDSLVASGNRKSECEFLRVTRAGCGFLEQGMAAKVAWALGRAETCSDPPAAARTLCCPYQERRWPLLAHSIVGGLAVSRGTPSSLGRWPLKSWPLLGKDGRNAEPEQ